MEDVIHRANELNKEDGALKNRILKLVKESGAHSFALMYQKDMMYNYSFRDICRKNICGEYGKCWMCPPDIGDVNDLTKKAQLYRYGVMYNTVSELEDSFDFEGMLAGKKIFNIVARKITEEIRKTECNILHLGVGACGICERCAKKDDKPCRYPEYAVASMESYGFFVSETAKRAGLKYFNGRNTVTYFGMVLFG